MTLVPPPVHSSSSSYVFGLCFVVLYLILFQTQIASSALLLSSRNQHNKNQKKKPIFHNQTSCNVFVGSWVRDDTLPIYQSSHCPIIDPQFNCQMYGRPDTDYQRYQWRPDNCELPRFDGLEFLVRMRGKSVMFVGDSLGKNQWESLICMISVAVPYTSTQIIRGEPLSRFNFLDYGVTLSYYKATYLVDIDQVQGKRVLKLDEISNNAEAWKGVDVLSFNSGHWWIHQGGLQGWDYMESEGLLYLDMDRLAAFERGMRTWSRWVDTNIDRTRIAVFFQAISPTHYDPSEWNGAISSKNCYGERAPVSGDLYPGPYPDQMKVVQAVLRDMKVPASLLDITTLSELRKDGHPSIYSGDLSPGQRANPDRSADCSHWCLPGLPDTWNQLFYTALFF